MSRALHSHAQVLSYGFSLVCTCISTLALSVVDSLWFPIRWHTRFTTAYTPQSPRIINRAFVSL
ncbi:hypothetical protein FIBSPDRAFT_208472 [Athelia psychrophila]|uniref:Uncharacterized protein n=1 Tax=Athelia psychrophila TaxID=1759441 RepID=A0A166WMU1_9AGAM|nr:hypothetical protein FIBSPDRAFT_208472 [Fibularhizoctonia sp. CBS 109695]